MREGSLYTDETTSWNVGHLPSTLSRLLPSSDQGLPGVNTPYLYFGMWRATFAWHVEDMDLFSINYIHFGAPKFWYSVPQGRSKALEQTMRGGLFFYIVRHEHPCLPQVISRRIRLLVLSSCVTNPSLLHQPFSPSHPADLTTSCNMQASLWSLFLVVIMQVSTWDLIARRASTSLWIAGWTLAGLRRPASASVTG